MTQWLLALSGDAIGPATSQGGVESSLPAGLMVYSRWDHRMVWAAIAPVYRWRCAVQPRRGRSVQTSQRAGLEEDWWTWEPAQ